MMGVTKNIRVTHQKHDFQFYNAVVKYRLLEKYGKKERANKFWGVASAPSGPLLVAPLIWRHHVIKASY